MWDSCLCCCRTARFSVHKQLFKGHFFLALNNLFTKVCVCVWGGGGIVISACVPASETHSRLLSCGVYAHTSEGDTREKHIIPPLLSPPAPLRSSEFYWLLNSKRAEKKQHLSWFIWTLRQLETKQKTQSLCLSGTRGASLLLHQLHVKSFRSELLWLYF